MRSRVCPLGAPTRNIDGSLSSAVTSWKVENQTASDTWARSSWATAVHNWSWSLTCTSIPDFNRCPHNCPHHVDNSNLREEGTLAGSAEVPKRRLATHWLTRQTTF